MNVQARDVVVATHRPFVDRGGLAARMEQRRSYVVTDRAEGEVPDGMFISTGEPEHSIRTAPYEGGTLLIVSGEGHPPGRADDTPRAVRPPGGVDA